MDKILRVGLTSGQVGNYEQDAVRGIAEYGRRFGPFRLLARFAGEIDLQSECWWKDLDGIIVSHFGSGDPHPAGNWLTDLPIVSIQQVRSEISPWQIKPDNRLVGRMVAEEFVLRAFKCFAYCPYPDIYKSSELQDWDQERLEGFSAIVRSVGAEPHVYPTTAVRWGEFAPEYSGPMVQWLQSLPRPIGIMACSDLRARQILLAAESANLAVPEELAVIGVDNELWAETVAGGISSVELDGYRAGYLAMEMLHQRMKGVDVPPSVVRVPPGPLVTRRSSDVTAIEDPEVAAALRFIAEHATAGIGVREVVEAVSLSRRALELRFGAALDRSIMQEIRAVQIQRARLLLSDPEISLPRIAKACGFRSAKALTEIFYRIVGVTPRAFRASARK